MFQYMPPRGGQPDPFRPCPLVARFNTCPHAGGNRESWRAYKGGKMFQYMPPRGGQRASTVEAGGDKNVSIHAPTRGATPKKYDYKPRSKFQYMPPRGGQPIGKRRKDEFSCFNTCPHAGGNPVKITSLSPNSHKSLFREGRIRLSKSERRGVNHAYNYLAHNELYLARTSTSREE